jgi:iron complex outermembrane recepter protein
MATICREASSICFSRASQAARVLRCLHYEFPLTGGHTSVQGNLTYTGDFYQNLTNFDSTRVGSYVLYGARIGWTNSDGKWDFSVTGKNLGNKLHRTVGFDLSDFGGATQTTYGPPR